MNGYDFTNEDEIFFSQTGTGFDDFWFEQYPPQQQSLPQQVVCPVTCAPIHRCPHCRQQQHQQPRHIPQPSQPSQPSQPYIGAFASPIPTYAQIAGTPHPSRPRSDYPDSTQQNGQSQSVRNGVPGSEKTVATGWQQAETSRPRQGTTATAGAGQSRSNAAEDYTHLPIGDMLLASAQGQQYSYTSNSSSSGAFRPDAGDAAETSAQTQARARQTYLLQHRQLYEQLQVSKSSFPQSVPQRRDFGFDSSLDRKLSQLPVATDYASRRTDGTPMDMRTWNDQPKVPGDRLMIPGTPTHLIDPSITPPGSEYSSSGRSRRDAQQMIERDELNPHRCDTCNKTYSSVGELSKHIRRCHGLLKDRPHGCPLEQCPQRFNYPREVKRHVASIHAHVKPFYCNFFDCKFAGIGFSRNDHLARHLRTVHRESGSSQSMSRSSSSRTHQSTTMNLSG